MNEEETNKEIMTTPAQNQVMQVHEIESNKENRADSSSKKKTPVWQWLLLSALFISLVIGVFMSPALNKYLPVIPSSTHTASTSYSSSSSRSAYPSRVSNTPSTPAMNTTEAYVGLTMGIPIMIAILTVLTLLNTIMFMAMAVNLSNIKTAIVDIFENRITK